MADVKFEVVSADIPANVAVNSTIDLDVAGFGVPKAVVLFYTRGGADGVANAAANNTISMWDGTSSYLTNIRLSDGTISQSGSRYNSTSRAITDTKGSSITTLAYDFTDLHTDGVRITCAGSSTHPSGKVIAILIGGDDVTAVVKNNYGWGSSGTNTFTGVGFEPDMLMFTTNCVGGTDAYSNYAATSFGVAINDGLETQRSLSRTAGLGNATGYPKTDISNNTIYKQLGSSTETNVDHYAALASFTADGFTTTQTGNSGSDAFGVLCLKFDNNPDIALFDTSIPTSGNIAEDGLGFTPTFGMVHATEGPTSRNSTNRWGSSTSWSMFDANGTHTQVITNENLASEMVCKGVWYDSFSALSSDGSALMFDAGDPVFDSQGWDITLTANPSTEVLAWGLAIGDGTGGGGLTLTVNSSLHSHLADHLSLIQKSTLSVAEALHSHSADNLALTQKNTLAVNESLHGHSADSVALSQSSVLVVGDATHGHSSDNLTLTQKSTLAVDNAAHAHAVDSIVLASGSLLAVQGAIHAHTAANIALIQKNTLTVQEALHSVGSDNLTLSNSINLTVFDSTHSHMADAVTLSAANILAVQDAIHSVSSESLGLITDAILIVDSTLHALISDTINFNIGSIETPASRTYVVPFENRVFVVPYENRIYIVKG